MPLTTTAVTKVNSTFWRRRIMAARLARARAAPGA